MSARSAYLQEGVGLLACYGKSYQKHDDDCIECEVQSDCESLTALRKQRGKAAVAKKKPAQTEEVEPDEFEDSEEEDREELYRRWAMPWSPPSPKRRKKKVVNAYPYPPQGYGLPPHPLYPPSYPPPLYCEPSEVYNPYFPPHLRYPPPVPVRPHPSVEQFRRDRQMMQAMGYQPPGTHQTTFAIDHPTSPHLSYVFGNPVHYPMPRPGEGFFVRLLRNVFTRVVGDVFGGIGDEVLGYCVRNRM